MRRGPVPGLLSLGLIGVGPSWERRYRPAVRRLSQRMGIRVVHDPVLSRAQGVAQETGAEVAAGLMQVIEHPGLSGVLVLDAGWYGLTPLEFACDRQKPLFFGGNWHESAADWHHLAECAQTRGVMLVPELSLRFQPATTRLRELIATRLGPVKHLRVQVHSPRRSDGEDSGCAVAAAIDWCCYVTRRRAELLSLSSTKFGENAGEWALSFRPEARGPDLEPAEITLCHEPNELFDARDIALEAVVECERGRAVLTGSFRIRWSTADSAENVEHLELERSGAEVMLDQFCRRLVGGLIPTATLSDIALALEQVQRLKG